MDYGNFQELFKGIQGKVMEDLVKDGSDEYK